MFSATIIPHLDRKVTLIFPPTPCFFKICSFLLQAAWLQQPYQHAANRVEHWLWAISFDSKQDAAWFLARACSRNQPWSLNNLTRENTISTPAVLRELTKRCSQAVSVVDIEFPSLVADVPDKLSNHLAGYQNAHWQNDCPHTSPLHSSFKQKQQTY